MPPAVALLQPLDMQYTQLLQPSFSALTPGSRARLVAQASVWQLVTGQVGSLLLLQHARERAEQAMAASQASPLQLSCWRCVCRMSSHVGVSVMASGWGRDTH